MTNRQWLALARFALLVIPPNGAAAGALRFGTCYRTGRNRITQHLRFHGDGSVISAANPEHYKPAPIAGWFHRDSATVAKGRYSVRGEALQLSLYRELAAAVPQGLKTSARAAHAYSGVIGADHLFLRRNGAGEERKFEFAGR